MAGESKTNNRDGEENGKGPNLLKFEKGSGLAGTPFDSAERALPFSSDAERGCLSCMLQSPEPLVGQSVQVLTEEAFYVPAHRILFQAMIELYDENQPIEPITLTQLLDDTKRLQEAGGAAGIADLYGFVSNPAHFEHYADIVREKYVLRSIINTCSESIQNAYDGGRDVMEILDEVEAHVLAIRQQGEDGGKIRPLKDHVMDAIDLIEKMITDPDGMKGIPTGFKGLDSMTNGLHGGEMFVIAARPSMGKTSFAMNIAEYVAIDAKTPVAVFSLEMPARQLVLRLLCSRAMLSMTELQGGLISKEGQGKLARAAATMKKATLIIDDSPGMSILDMKARTRQYKQMYGIELIVIDYMQLMKSNSRRAQDNRQIEIAEISGGLKALAKELDIPVIVLAQLNRAVEQRTSKRPMLSDLRESGSIEQDADIVGLLTRTDYASYRDPDADDEDDEDKIEGESVLILAKHRNGATGDVPLTFIDSSMRFVDRELREGEVLGD